MVNSLSRLDAVPTRLGAGSGWARAFVDFILLAGGLIALFNDAALSMVRIWWSSSSYHHGFLVAPLAAWLIFRSREWRSVVPRADWRGAAIIAAAGVLWLFGRASGVSLFGHAAIVLAIIGAAISSFGGEFAARSRFALGFLFFMTPFGAEAIPVLQHMASVAVGAALNFSGIDTARDGFMLSTSAGRFEMAQSCAGLRFVLAATMIAAIVAHLSFRLWRAQVAFVFAAIAGAVLANWLRAYLIVVVATVTDRRIGVGPEHVAFGWIFYSALILGLIVLARRLGDAGAPVASPVSQGRNAARSANGYAAIALSIAASIVIYDRAVVSKDVAVSPPPSLVPLEAEGFASLAANSGWAPSAPGADAIAMSRHFNAKGSLDVAAVYFTHDREGAEIASVGVAAGDGVEWRRVAIRIELLEIDGRRMRVPVETLQDSVGRKLEVAKVYWLGEREYASAAQLKLAVGAARLIGKSAPGGVFFVAADYREGGNPLIGEFLAGAQSVADWRGRMSAGA